MDYSPAVGPPPVFDPYAVGGTVPAGAALEVCQAISTDGTTIIGHGYNVGAFKITIAFDEPCPADCAPDNGDGTYGNAVVNIDDLLATVNAFGATGGPCDSAPDNGDGTFGNNQVNIDDLLTVINAFGACP